MNPAKLKEIKIMTGTEKADKLGLSSTRFILNQMSSNAQNLINSIKKRDHPKLSPQGWQQKQYYKTNATRQLFGCCDSITRDHISKLSVKNFIEKYEKNSIPIIIDGCTQNWDIDRYWTFDHFYEEYKDKKFTVGESKSGKSLKIIFKDDSPLLLMEGCLEDDEILQQIIDRYQIPPYFKEDLLSYAGERYRPPFRWLQIGPERSGTTINTDILNNSAWSTLLAGYKRWVLFPPHIPKFIVKGKGLWKQNIRYEPIEYFLEILPKIIENEGSKNLGNPGQTVFIPSGWWFAYINLEETISITQNFVSQTNFDNVWRALRSKRIKFAEHFLLLLRKHEFSLYQRAIKLNKTDKFRMGNKFEAQSVSLSFTSNCKSKESDFEYSSVSYSRSSKRSNSENSRGRSRQKPKRSRSLSQKKDKLPPLL